MARVPTYDNLQTQVSAQPNVQVQAPSGPTAGGIAAEQQGQIGKAMMGAGDAMTRIGLDMQQERSKTEASDIDTAFAPALNDIRNRFIQQHGKNAVDNHPAYMDEVTALRAKTLDSITNPMTRQLVSNTLNHRVDAATSTMQTHFLGQDHNWKVDSATARMEMSANEAASNYADPIMYQASLGTALLEVNRLQELQGFDSERASLMRQKVFDTVGKQKYDTFKLQDAAKALEDFHQNGKDLSPIVRDSIDRELFNTATPQLVQMLLKSGITEHQTPKAGVTGSTLPGANEPRGVRNNNPLNVSKGGDVWQGAVDGTDKKYVTFESPEAGIRAASKTLVTYQDRYGLNTVDGIISRWAPATENNTASYIAAVSSALGVKPGDKIDVKDPQVQQKMITAMVKVENGKNPYSDQQISAGIAAGIGGAELPKGQTTASPQKYGIDLANSESVTGITVIDGLTPDQKLRIFHTAAAQQKHDSQQLRETLNDRVKDSSAEYMVTGTATKPPTQDEFLRAYGQVEGMKRFDEFNGVATLGANVQSVQKYSNAQIDQLLVDSKPAPGEGFAAREKNFEYLQKAAAHVKEVRQKDPVLYAMQTKSYGLTPLTTFSNPEKLAADLTVRAKSMDRLSADYQTRPFVLSAQEADAFGGYIGSLQATDRARMLETVFTAVGPVGMQSISTQLKDKHDTISVAAMLSTNRTTAGNSAALLYLQGKEAIEQKRAKIDDTAETGIKSKIFTELDGVYQTPAGRDAAAEAAFGIYAKLKADGSDDVDRALRLATGGLMKFNGSKIAKPYGWDDQRFNDSVSNYVVPKGESSYYTINGNAITRDQLQSSLLGSKLLTFGNGAYMVQSAGGIVMDGNKPFVLRVK